MRTNAQIGAGVGVILADKELCTIAFSVFAEPLLAWASRNAANITALLTKSESAYMLLSK